MDFFELMRSILIVLAIAAVGIVSCNNAVTRPPAQSKLSAEGTQKVMDMMTKYYALKNALVATKATDVAGTATTLATAAEAIQQDSAATPVKQYLDTVITQSKAIAGIADKTCEQQRIIFEHVSSAMYGLLKAVEIKNAGSYKQYCPMAFNNKGAYWLSEEEDIKNPYFGDKMLECGEVTDSL